MKKIFSKLTKLIAVLLISVLGINSVITNVNAASDTIEVGGAEAIPALIGGTYFAAMMTTDGNLVYCLDLHKTTTTYQTLSLVGEMDAGFTYIMKNGYPAREITGNRQFDIYITQTAVWWYLDETTGSANISDYFKTGPDDNNLRGYVSNLVNGAISAKDAGYATTAINIINDDSSLSLNSDKTYFESNKITVNSSNIDNYTVSLSDAPVGTIITNESGEEKTTFGASEKFIVKVPVANISSTSVNFKATVSASGSVEKAYKYAPNDTDTYQSVATSVLETITTDVSDTTTFKIETSKITIVKLDKTTGKAVAGATLVLKDSDGNVVTSWTSTTKGHVIKNLADGDYTIEEVEAPKGYKKLKEPVKFTIDASSREQKIKVTNEAKTTVVNIVKVDASTGKVLPGAVLVVKNSKGEEIAKFTTTEDPYVLTELEDGTYTVEEISAPEGYELSEEKQTFTIDDDHLSYQITFKNYPKVVVPDTASTASTVMYILGFAIIGYALRFVYKNGQAR